MGSGVTMEGLLKGIGKYKYLLLVLAVGLVLILLPTKRGAVGYERTESLATEREARLEEVLSGVEGVGRAAVLFSDEGVVVVCDGADSAAVRLDVVNAVSAYTGYGSGAIRVLKMETIKEAVN